MRRKEPAMALADIIKMQKYLSDISYPATRQQLIEHARNSHADEQVLNALQELPDREYSGPDQVSNAVAED
jgi:hypothetical protein